MGAILDVSADNGVDRDSMDENHAVVPQHYAFFVDDTSFDARQRVAVDAHRRVLFFETRRG